MTKADVQADFLFLYRYSVALCAIPHLLSFATPEHDRQFRSVEATLGLSFL
jgi:hypothetical protein